MESIFMNTEKSNTSKPREFNLNLSDSQNKYVPFQNFSENSKRNNKLKIIAPTWNDEFELSDGFYFVSDFKDYIPQIIKK